MVPLCFPTNAALPLPLRGYNTCVFGDGEDGGAGGAGGGGDALEKGEGDATFFTALSPLL